MWLTRERIADAKMPRYLRSGPYCTMDRFDNAFVFRTSTLCSLPLDNAVRSGHTPSHNTPLSLSCFRLMVRRRDEDYPGCLLLAVDLA